MHGRCLMQGRAARGPSLKVGRHDGPAETWLGEKTQRGEGIAAGSGVTPVFPHFFFFSLSGSSWALWKSRPPWPSWSQSEYLLWGLEVGPWRYWDWGYVWGASKGLLVGRPQCHRHSVSAPQVPGGDTGPGSGTACWGGLGRERPLEPRALKGKQERRVICC